MILTVDRQPPKLPSMQTATQRRRIAVFDSGVGGLTVLGAVHAALPWVDLRFLGDTARLPYGTKSASTVERYALQASKKLVEVPVDALVVACNTASSCAIPALQAAYPFPVLGVIGPTRLNYARIVPVVDYTAQVISAMVARKK